MRLLLDTHALLWWLTDDRQLCSAAREAIASPDNAVLISAVTVWEIVIKRASGKLQVSPRFAQVLAEERFTPLPITTEHALQVGLLPALHRDPFDRLLVAQALVEGLTIVTHDDRVASYGVPVLKT